MVDREEEPVVGRAEAARLVAHAADDMNRPETGDRREQRSEQDRVAWQDRLRDLRRVEAEARRDLLARRVRRIVERRQVVQRHLERDVADERREILDVDRHLLRADLRGERTARGR